ncbi:MAG: MFS transporter [Actinomycetaceae bacterium]|nr:MFS transporter [Actinomycetaceae bacterium]
MNKTSKMPTFLQKGKIGAFLTVVMAGQLVYSSFEAFKGSLMLPLCNALGIGVDDFGKIMSILGLAMFMYVPAGWVNNRFTIRSILLVWSAWRLMTFLLLYLIPGLPFKFMLIIAFTWAVWDAIGWPAVVNGVSFVAQDSDSKGRGLAMGLLETIRRAAEFLMNIVIVGFIALYPNNANQIMLGFAIGYALLLIPLIFAILRYVPKNAIAHSEDMGHNAAAAVGLFKVLAKPRVWMAGIAAMCLYWCYVNLIYSSAPYLKLVFHASDATSGVFGILNTGLVGVFAGLISGFIADYVFKSSTVMMACALTITAVGTFLVWMLPSKESMMWPAIILLMVMSVGVFMGKAVLLAPVAELHLPEEINGSAMAVGSFLAYASVLWGNYVTSGLVEHHKDNPYVGYQQIFWITLVVAAVGAACAFGLAVLNKRIDAKVTAGTDAAEVKAENA